MIDLSTRDAEQVTRIAPYVGRLALAAMTWEGRAIAFETDGNGIRPVGNFTPAGAVAELEDIIGRARAELGPLADTWGDIARIRKVADRLLAPIRQIAELHREGNGRKYFVNDGLERTTQDARCHRCGAMMLTGERMQRDPETLLPVHPVCQP